MDYNYTQPQQFQPVNRMETASFILGIISLATCACLYISIVCGALAIMFALLSRGGSMQLSSRAKFSIILGVLGIVVSTITLVVSIFVVTDYYGSFENFLRAYCDMANIDFDSIYGGFFQ